MNTKFIKMLKEESSELNTLDEIHLLLGDISANINSFRKVVGVAIEEDIVEDVKRLDVFELKLQIKELEKLIGSL